MPAQSTSSIYTILNAGSYEASEQAYNEGGQVWVDNLMLDLFKQNRELGKQILLVATFSEQNNLSPSQTAILASSLILDALNRDETGKQLDTQYGLVSERH